MRRPALDAIVERRLLVNYRAEPEVVASLLPGGLRPHLVRDQSVVGICLIRMGGLRPAGLPPWVGGQSENAAHRFAVEWDGSDGTEVGVYIPRRDTSVSLNALASGRVYPGVSRRADFEVDEKSDRLRVAFRSRDGSGDVRVEARPAEDLRSRLFDDVKAASAFFEHGCLGLSPGRGRRPLEGIRLTTRAWSLEPVEVLQARSSFFDDADRFPPGSLTLDCGLVIRDVPVRWHAVP